MSDLQAIAVAYERVDLHLQSLRDAEDGGSEDPSPDSVDREQRLNDQAYFVLAWGQLEADIEEACREAIREGQRTRTGGIAAPGRSTTRRTAGSRV